MLYSFRRITVVLPEVVTMIERALRALLMFFVCTGIYGSVMEQTW